MQPIIDFLSQYTHVTEEELSALVQLIHFSSHEKNELLQKQGAISKRAAFVVKGAVRIFYLDEKGTEHTVNFIFENQPLVSFDSFTQQTPVVVSAVTLMPTELIWTSYSEFFDFLEKFPKYETALRSILSQYMTLGSEHLKLLRINSARERYETLKNMRPEVIQKVPLKYIASYLGMALETLSRVRAGKL